MGKRQKFSGVYIIENFEDGRVYVGSAIDIHSRWGQHRRELLWGTHKNSYLQNAWNKCGEGSFCFQVIEHCDRELLLEREQVWIDLLCSFKRDYGYNLSPTAGSTIGVPCPLDKREKISKSLSGDKHPLYGKHLPEKTKARISLANKGRVVSMEARNKMSLAKKGRVVSKETGRKISEANTGRTHSKEVRRRMSIAQAGENNPMYGRRGDKNPLYGTTLSKETRAKISVARNPEVVEYMGEIRTIAEWAAYFGINKTTLTSRLHNLNWTPEQALKTPTGGRRE